MKKLIILLVGLYIFFPQIFKITKGQRYVAKKAYTAYRNRRDTNILSRVEYKKRTGKLLTKRDKMDLLRMKNRY